MSHQRTGFAGDYTARTYGLIPPRNGVDIRLGPGAPAAGWRTPSGLPVRTASHGLRLHAQMLEAVQPTIDNIACANAAHGRNHRGRPGRGARGSCWKTPGRLAGVHRGPHG
ncbi:MAG: hypothetical protein Ct9H300mP1_11720 [Planctomycetaceae bacterium]|nr:MAG: hypothetical protein Ct9H300mP1_11720 [Planctomycetaceae bacterium]